jgi:hypothetical protein
VANLPRAPRYLFEAPPSYHRKLAGLTDQQLDRAISRAGAFYDRCFDECEEARRALNLLDRRMTKAIRRYQAAQEEGQRRVANG